MVIVLRNDQFYHTMYEEQIFTFLIGFSYSYPMYKIVGLMEGVWLVWRKYYLFPGNTA